MINKAFERIDASDLQALVDGGVSEHRTLEFKRELGAGKGPMVELVRDLTALANGQGGDLLIGVSDKKGVAEAVVGVEIADLDARRLDFENAIRDRTEPRLNAFQIAFIALAAGRHVIHFRVRPSLAAPHAVRNDTHRYYYNRNSAGKYEMDAGELRDAFNANEQLFPRLRRLHQDAIRRSRGRDMPFRLNAAPRCIVSLVPRSYFVERVDLPITRENALIPFRTRGYDFIPSLEGLIAHSPLKNGKDGNLFDTVVDSYVLNHWGGHLDIGWTIGTPPQSAVDRLETEGPWRSDHYGMVSPEAFEQGLLGMIRSGIVKLRELGREGPWLAFVTVKGLEHARLALDADARSMPASRKTAYLGELSMDEATPETLMVFARRFWLLFSEQRPIARALGAK